MTERQILVQDDGAVRTLTLNRPHRLNAFTAANYGLLADDLEQAATDDVAVVVLRGAGRAFCSGVDFAALADGEQLRLQFERLVHALLAFPKPLIAAVHGVGVGFGLTVLLYADLVVAADDARLRAPFAQLNTAPEAGSSWLLPRLVGPRAAADLVLTGRWLPTPEAVGLGLVTRTCPAEQLEAEVTHLAREVAALPGPAVQAAKRLLRNGWTGPTLAALDREFQASGRLGGLAVPPAHAG